MKSNVIVIIACDKLCKSLRYLGQLEYENGPKVDYVGFYMCGADDKDDVEVFIENLLNQEDFSDEQKDDFRQVLDFAENSDVVPIDEDFKLFIVRNMHRLDFNSWMCMPTLMESERYLVLPVEEGVEPPAPPKDV